MMTGSANDTAQSDEGRIMEYVAQKMTASLDATPCQWSADDCYPATVLFGLDPSTQPLTAPRVADLLELEVV